MKNTHSITLLLLAAAAALGSLQQSQAQTTYYWDNNGSTAGFGTAAKTWSAITTGNSTQGWSTDPAGTVVPGNVTTTTSDSLNFGNSTTGLAAGTITVSGAVDSGNLTFASGSGAIVLSGGNINLAASATLTVNNATTNSNTISSNITGAGTSLVKAGSGLLILSGTNTNSGSTSVNAGILLATKAAALSGYNSSGKVVFNGGTVGVRTSGSGWTTAEVDSLLGNATKTSGTLGIDTTNGDLTQWTDFTTANFGNALGLTKFGTGNFTLTGANTYNGSTTVQGNGRLIISGTGAINPTAGATLTVGASSSGGTLQYDSSATSKFGAINVGNGSGTPGTLNQTNGTINGSGLVLSTGFGSGNGAVTIGNASGNAAAMNISGAVTVSAASSGVTSTLVINNTGTLAITGNLQFATVTNRDANGMITQAGGSISAASLSLSSNVNDTPAARTHTSVYNLNGGTLSVGSITTGVVTTNGTISNTFNFAGGTLKATSNNATFWASSGNTTANVKDGGAIIDTNSFDIAIAQPLVHFAGATTDTLAKNGAGSLTLTANNTYAGTTTVTAGTLVISGTSASPTFSVASGATLTNNATSALTSALALTEGSNLAGSGNFTTSSVAVTADLGDGFTSINLGTTLTKNVVSSLDFSLSNVTDGTYAVFLGTAPTGLFSSVSVGGNALTPIGGNIFSANVGGTTYTYDDSGFGSLIVAVPEPGTWVLVGIGLTFLLYRKPRRFES